MKQKIEYLKNTVSGKWVILAPQRKKRPRFAKGTEPICPFCPGHEHLTPPEVSRVDGGGKDKSKWEIRVVPNLYPFAPIHEVIIDSPEHSESFLTLPPDHISKLFKVYRDRFRELKVKGQVVIFYNYGSRGAASLPHPHAQLAVLPKKVQMDVTRAVIPENIVHESRYFTVFIPNASGWPYEVWFLPKKRGRLFDSITNEEIDNLAQLLSKILKKMESLLGEKFPFNFHIYHAGDWYLRLMPRTRVLGGFEIATGVYVHSKSPEEAAKELSF
jgi:UDPglucose--hexose-1-phosphate uridylyltransferase